jgi:hypothetical protein
MKPHIWTNGAYFVSALIIIGWDSSFGFVMAGMGAASWMYHRAEERYLNGMGMNYTSKRVYQLLDEIMMYVLMAWLLCAAATVPQLAMALATILIVLSWDMSSHFVVPAMELLFIVFAFIFFNDSYIYVLLGLAATLMSMATRGDGDPTTTGHGWWHVLQAFSKTMYWYAVWQ